MTAFELSEKQRKQINQKGISELKLNTQIRRFKEGFQAVELSRPATIGDGIHQFDLATTNSFVEIFKSQSTTLKLVKFVPASGAATRMFRQLYALLRNGNSEMNKELSEFFDSIYQFAFTTELEEVLEKNGFNLKTLLAQKDHSIIAKYLLTELGMAYGMLPKALLKFHLNQNLPTTALQEQLFEAATYAVNNDGKARLHFTISQEHIAPFKAALEAAGAYYESRFGLEYEIVISHQLPSTDIIAVDFENQPLVDENDLLIFRPGGHGALIENLNQELADLIFIKNIDNVAPEHLSIENADFKMLLGGVLIDIQTAIKGFLNELDTNGFSSALAQKVSDFGIKMLYINWNFQSEQEIRSALNRPIRVCGMVKNDGEPGGGPFWVKTNLIESLQIVESSQINQENENQLQILNSSTHFNPVDLVCAIIDYKGNKFNLKDFLDENAGFITAKSVEGKSVKAQELPGLWNGAMAKWITVFVEVPLQTFNPVKTINDLLKPNHQAS